MKVIAALILVLILLLVVYLGVDKANQQHLFGVIIPYAAIAIFLIGFIYRIVSWTRSAVPFRITTTCGQQKSLDFIKPSKIENPSGLSGVIVRMALEVLLFRSLFRNTKAELKENGKLVYGPDKWLWASALAFHWSFLIIFLRHYRFFAEPVPSFVIGLQ
ncbi:MAG: menaquinol oxidoreductase, partial [Candidatus Krumholzibacteria bacterium]|nr:menaquinol oxidoreductase [Candidatus Krumholzibacteria bacterium]